MGQAIRRRSGNGFGRGCHSSGSPFCPKPGSVGCSPSRARARKAASPSCLHKTPVRRPRTDFLRRRDSPAFALPATLRRETRRDSAPPRSLTREVSFADAPLCFFVLSAFPRPCPLRGRPGQTRSEIPMPYRDSAHGLQKLTRERGENPLHPSTHHKATRGIPVRPFRAHLGSAVSA
jgi:hypothetical protein